MTVSIVVIYYNSKISMMSVVLEKSKDLLSKVRLEGQFTFRSPDCEGYRNA